MKKAFVLGVQSVFFPARKYFNFQLARLSKKVEVALVN